MIHREWISELHTANKLPDMPDLYDVQLDDVPMPDKIAQADRLESLALEFDKRITNVAYARYGDTSSQVWIANSKGLRGSYKTNACYAYARCLAKDGDNSVMAGDYEVHRGFVTLTVAESVKPPHAKQLSALAPFAPRPAATQSCSRIASPKIYLNLWRATLARRPSMTKLLRSLAKSDRKCFRPHSP